MKTHLWPSVLVSVSVALFHRGNATLCFPSVCLSVEVAGLLPLFALSQVVITVDGLAQLELDQNKWDKKDRRGKKQLTQG